MKTALRFTAILFLIFGINAFATSLEIEFGSQAKDAAAIQDVSIVNAPSYQKTSSQNLSILHDENTFCMINVFSIHLYYV
ncbi:hypothetical protein [Polynucleobacter necessarius]|uniref:hypothetical protein n=1 Tax=Polynucleobacter necessarius TaxID=576610 RepID=UPI000E092148|nr:hypothetical protein [Polynucleobacter necessarius]